MKEREVEALVLKARCVSPVHDKQRALDAPCVRRETLDHAHVLLDEFARAVPADRVLRRVPCGLVDFEGLEYRLRDARIMRRYDLDRVGPVHLVAVVASRIVADGKKSTSRRGGGTESRVRTLP